MLKPIIIFGLIITTLLSNQYILADPYHIINNNNNRFTIGEEQTIENKTVLKYKQYDIHLQLTIRDKDQTLIVYEEPRLLYIIRPDLVESCLKDVAVKEVSYHGIQYDLKQYKLYGIFNKDQTETKLMAQYMMMCQVNEKWIPITSFLNNGYEIMEGDSVSVIWTILSPSQT